MEEWLFWQVGGLGPMAGQANHFLNYAQEDLPYAKKRYTDEVHRLFGVMNTQAGHAQIPGRRLFHRRHGVLELGSVGFKSIHRFWPNSPPGRLVRARVGRAPAVARQALAAGRNCASQPER